MAFRKMHESILQARANDALAALSFSPWQERLPPRPPDVLRGRAAAATQRAAHHQRAAHIPPPLLRPLPGTARADPLAGQWQLYACISSHTGGWRPVWLCGISCRRREVTGNGQSGSGLVLCSSEYVTLHTSTKNHRLRAVSSRAARMILPASA